MNKNQLILLSLMFTSMSSNITYATNDNGSYAYQSDDQSCPTNIPREQCDLLQANQGFVVSEDENAPVPSAEASIPQETDPSQARPQNWNSCFTSQPNKNIEVFQQCVKLSRRDLKITHEPEFAAATGEAKTCQAVFMEAGNTGGTRWSDISREVYRSGFSSLVDYNKAVAIFAANDTKNREDGTPSVAEVQDASRSVISCNLLAAVYGENLEEGREQESPYMQPEKLTSMDGKITCRLSGLETVDYDECSTLITTHNAAEIGQAANTTFQTYEMQDYKSEQQHKLMNMDATSNVTTTALKSQKEGLDKQQEMAEERRNLQTIRFGAILSLANLIPTMSSFVEEDKLCRNPANGALNNIEMSVREHITSEGIELCKRSLSTTRFALFRNAEAIRAGNRLAAEAGIDVAKESMAVSQLGKQKKMIANAIGKIEGMQTIDLPEDFYQNEDVYMQFCTANPTHADCQSGFGATVNVPSFGDYNVGGFGSNQAYEATETTESQAVTAATTADPVSANVDTSTAVSKTSASGGLKGRFGSGATVTEGGQIAQGAGGGGSNPGGGGGGGGSSAGAQGQPQPGATAASGGTKGLNYIGGKGPSFVGGRGIASKRTKKSNTNPFKNMFNKTKDRNLSSLNYNGKTAIGSKSDNLFQRISSAYDKANNQGNLLKYETKSIE